MNITIHRGAKEIGGTCIEVKSANSKILIDFGLPLVDEYGEQFSAKNIIDLTKEELITKRILPNLLGLYSGETPQYDAILLSHPHQDHYGLLSFVNNAIPVYMSRGCKELMDVSYLFGQTPCNLDNIQLVEAWVPFTVRDFIVTPYLVDHSGFDAFAYLIEADGKRLFYSGDFRGHGRKSILFDNILKHPPRKIDCLILEGSMIGRAKGGYETEGDVENAIVTLCKTQRDLLFIACSSQNIDRLVSVYRACKRSNRIFVVDPYTAFILDRLKTVSPNIPQFNWGNNIRVFFVPNKYTERLAEDKTLFKFKSAKIQYDEIMENRHRVIIKDAYTTRQIFASKKDIANSLLIYSMWDGYLEDVRSFWDKHGIPIERVHVSGHADVDDLRRLASALNPRIVMPNHTFHPDIYKELFNNVMEVSDGQEVTI